MKQVLAGITILCLSVCILSQTPERLAPPVADVHEVNPNGLLGAQGGVVGSMTGPFVGGGLYRLKSASMLELIAQAYGVPAGKVAGGPSWITFNRYDVTAKLPAGAGEATIKTMLQELLADRFKLTVHEGEGPLTAWSVKATAKPLLKAASGSGEGVCTRQPVPSSAHLTGAVTSFACRNMTMQGLADSISKMASPNTINGYSVIDLTNLKGAWDFDISFRNAGRVPAGEEQMPFADAMPKQLGLEFALTRVTVPALVVDNVNAQPSPNPVNLAETLPKLPTAFEVAEIKPIAPDSPNPGYSSQVQPGGRVHFINFPLRTLITRAWSLTNESLVGPKFIDSERVELIAKVPALDESDVAGAAASRQADLVDTMLRTLITERFKVTAHFEDRSMTAYTLRAEKSKLRKADPGNRSGCLRLTDNVVDSTSGETGLRFNCQNMTMVQFVKFLQFSTFTGLRASVLDATGLEGGWDFSLSFTNGPGPSGSTNTATNAAPEAATPDDRISLSGAIESQLGLKLEKTMRPGPVLVIDHMEQRPLQQ